MPCVYWSLLEWVDEYCLLYLLVHLSLLGHLWMLDHHLQIILVVVYQWKLVDDDETDLMELRILAHESSVETR